MLRLDTHFATELEGFYVPWTGAAVPAPRILQLNRDLARELGLDPDALDSEEGAALLAGMEPPEGARPLAQAYAGHQFGGFVPQLGDGRALLLGEVVDPEGRHRDLHLKGSGPTPFARGGDGKAVLGPVLREYLMGEAMHALGIPTTRGLAAVTTGERIVRQSGPKPGAILARIASSHLRVGTFQFVAARGRTEELARLVAYALRRHDPDQADSDTPALALFRAVLRRQAALVARWMGVGFIHGVMNTDNTAISGETIDYGPCAFMDAYDPATVFSSIDHHGRYAYGQQPGIMQWNLARFAEALLPLLERETEEDPVAVATAEVQAFGPAYREAWLEVMWGKLGLAGTREEGRGAADEGGGDDETEAEAETDDEALIVALHEAMEGQEVDFTRLFRRLADALRGDAGPVRALFEDPTVLDPWLERWTARMPSDPGARRARADAMDRVNPLYIPRNHLVEAALEAAEEELDMGPFRTLLDVLRRPFEERPGLEEYEGPAPEDFGRYVTYCGT
jgi:uncharacterized protein YdiU (UPF0061 family)